MEEQINILLKTIDGLNATIASLSENHKKEVDSLNQRIKELMAQVAYLNRQLFGRKAERLPIYNPAQLDLFADQFTSEMKLAEEKAPTLLAFLMLLISSVPLYLFFRRCPKLPDLRFSEHVVALVYTSNMYSIYQIIADLIPFMSGIIKILSIFMVLVTLKQFTGYSKRRLLWYVFLSFLIIFVLLAAFVGLIVYIVVSRENAA